MVAFRGSQPGANFSLILSGGHVGTDATERLEVNGQPAEFNVNPVGAQNLAWDLCCRTLILGALESQIPRPELIRIAESVPEQCNWQGARCSSSERRRLASCAAIEAPPRALP